VAPHLLDQDGTATRPDEKWSGALTAVWTGCRMARAFPSCWLSSPGVSSDGPWGDPRRKARDETALRMALLGRQPAAGLLFPSDRGSPSTSDA
jgi:hypothetical protein